MSEHDPDADGSDAMADGRSPAVGRHRRESPSRLRDGGRFGRSVATLVLALLCLPAAAAGIVFWQQTPSSGSSTAPPLTASAAGSLLSAANQAAVAAAKSEVHSILSYDYRSISTDIARAKLDTTGVFAHQYASTASQLLSEAQQVKAIVQATIGSSGVVSSAPNQVVVLLFVDQASVRQTSGKTTPTTRIDQSRVRVTMSRVNGKWLVSDLAAL
jgi:Mce-associated membrane protein